MIDNSAVVQDCILKNRKELNLSGVKEVSSFDDKSVNLQTVLGALNIRGECIKIVSFNTDSGEAEVTGKINAIYYLNENSAREGFFKKLFK